MMSRLISTVLSGVILFGTAAGCGGPAGQSAPSSTSTDAVKSVDACALLTPTELDKLGRKSPGKKVDQLGESGCRFDGDPYNLAIYRSSDGIGFYDKRKDQYARFTTNKVGSRDGAQILISESGSECRQVVQSGAGSVAVVVIFKFGQSGDSCGQALQIAQQIEPRLPNK